jgi:hypothetical protein
MHPTFTSFLDLINSFELGHFRAKDIQFLSQRRQGKARLYGATKT